MHPLRSVIMLTVLIMAVQVVVSPAQKLKSPYQLKRVRVVMMDGTSFRCRILDATMDSLILQDETRLPLGSKVYVRVRYSDQGIGGYIQSSTETHLTLTDRDLSNPRVVPKNQIDLLKVKSSPLTAVELLQFQRKSLAASEIQYIAIHKRGSGLLGAVAGAAAGAGLMYAMSNSSAEPTSSTPSTSSTGNGTFSFAISFTKEAKQVGPTILGGLAGMAIGAAIGTSNRKHFINGSRTNYEEFIRRLKRTPSSRNQPK